MKKHLLLAASIALFAASCKKTDMLVQPNASASSSGAQVAAIAPRYMPIVTSVTQVWNPFLGKMVFTINFDINNTLFYPSGYPLYYCMVDGSNTVTSPWYGPHSVTNNTTGNTLVLHNNFAYMTGQRIAVILLAPGVDPNTYYTPGTVLTASIFTYLDFGTIF
jgi:hypothetical protein